MQADALISCHYSFFMYIDKGYVKRNASKHHLEPLAMSDTLGIPCRRQDSFNCHSVLPVSQAALINEFIMQQLCV